MDPSGLQASLQAESPPTIELERPVTPASVPGPKEDAEKNPPHHGSTKLPTDGGGKLGARNDTAAPPELPSHLKVLNFNFKEGVDDAINVVESDNKEGKVLVVLPVEAGSSEDPYSADTARPPFVLLASTAAPSTTTTTTTTTEAPTLPPSPSSTTPPALPALPPAPAGLLGLAASTAAPGSVTTTATLDPIRTGMKIIQSSTLFVPSPNPGKNDGLQLQWQ